MIEVAENKCDFCGCCVGVCPVNCIELKEADIRIDHELCIDCDICVFICPIKVLSQTDPKRTSSSEAA
ncbi:MAG TPA: hypothetical protein ENH49_04785 [Candidatus Marinimicrobia bacterium]|nr:hypothetical protein [Candidatus Neomarinimicrobiota bacterium]